jgi:hypothetical protein
VPEYILHRDYLLRTTNGVVSFEKDKPAWVVPAMERDAAQIGAQRVDGKDVDLLEAAVAAPVAAPAGDDRAGQFYAAFELLIERNDSKDFTGQGSPTVKALEKILGFDVERGEAGEYWSAFRVAKAEQ